MRPATIMSSVMPHQAAAADRDLLSDLAAACRWWQAQHTWRVSSSYTGGGAVAALERSVARRVAPDAHALALPSATAALATALRASGIRSGSTIGVPALDWAAARAVAASLGIRTKALPVTAEAGLLDAGVLSRHPELVEGLGAVIAVHLHGITCDVPALRRIRPELVIIEDAARAWGAYYPDGTAVGSAADMCAFSFGAAQSPSAGELGCLVTRSLEVHRNAVALTQHPARQLLTGIVQPRADLVMTRVAPAVAMLGAYVVQRHAAQIPALRQATSAVVTSMRSLGLAVLTDPSLHTPGVVTISAAPERVRAVLRKISLSRGVTVASVDQSSLHVHPDAQSDQALRRLAAAITTVTIVRRRPAHSRRGIRRLPRQ